MFMLPPRELLLSNLGCWCERMPSRSSVIKCTKYYIQCAITAEIDMYIYIYILRDTCIIIHYHCKRFTSSSSSSSSKTACRLPPARAVAPGRAAPLGALSSLFTFIIVIVRISRNSSSSSSSSSSSTTTTTTTTTTTKLRELWIVTVYHVSVPMYYHHRSPGERTTRGAWGGPGPRRGRPRRWRGRPPSAPAGRKV